MGSGPVLTDWPDEVRGHLAAIDRLLAAWAPVHVAGDESLWLAHQEIGRLRAALGQIAAHAHGARDAIGAGELRTLIWDLRAIAEQALQEPSA